MPSIEPCAGGRDSVGLLSTTIIELVERTTGILLVDDQLERKLLPLADERAGALGLNSAEAYLRLLAGEPPGGAEWSRVVEALTNGQTSFFRDPDQFAAIAAVLGRIAASVGPRPIEIWSGACSTGEEPYSLSILTAELGLSARILATDINPSFLERAQAARFGSWSLRNVDAARRERWFEPVDGDLRPREEVRARVQFRRHNLAREPAPRSASAHGKWHLILCRNVFLYFKRERIGETCRRLASSLAADGCLLVAASETLRGLSLPLSSEVVGGRVFYFAGRPAEKPAPPRRAVPPPTTPPPPQREKEPPPRPPDPEAVGQKEGAPAAILDRVASLAASGELEAARRLLDQRGEGGRRDLLYHLTLGHLHLRAHELDAALEAYRYAADADPLLCEVHFFYGLCRRKAGAWADAAVALRRALFLAPTFWQASYLLCGAYERLARTRDAARERARTTKLLSEPTQPVSFLSHPVFVRWFTVQEEEVRRLWRIRAPRGG